MSTKATVFMACVNLLHFMYQLITQKVDKNWLISLVMRVYERNRKYRVNLSTNVYSTKYKYIIYKYLYKYIRVIMVDSWLTKHPYRLTLG